MKLKDGFATAASALMVHKMRSFLASVGVMIGIGAVILMVAVGKGSQKEVLDVISKMGENLITVTAGEMKRRAGRLELAGNVNTLTLRDAKILLDDIPDLVDVAPYEYKELKIKYKNYATMARVSGSTPSFLGVRKFEIERGRFFDESDIKLHSRVAIVGKTTIQNIFGDEDPLGQTLRVATIPLTVIGVFKSKGMDADGEDQDDILMIPLTTLMRRVLNQTFIRTVYFQVRNKGVMMKAEGSIRDMLRQRHKLVESRDDDFTLQNQLNLEMLKREAAESFTKMIVGVAAISLLVGGVGILAVMLISVKERTREIGIRRAVGASKSDIVIQFILESLMLGLFGGVVGILMGVGLVYGLNATGSWNLILDTQIIPVATAVCVGVGMVFGIAPAIKASRLDPMEALTVE
jgi:putative ABC transport system permease protein